MTAPDLTPALVLAATGTDVTVHASGEAADVELDDLKTFLTTNDLWNHLR